MVYTVVCYKETGFSRGNIPSSPAVLENAAKITLQANQIWKLQDRFLSQVKLSMSWDDAKDVDYMKVGDSYYTIEGVEMSNGNVAIFTLAMDPITTVGGVSGFTLIDGWAKRCSPKNDDLFGNILPEPWAPAHELKMDGPFYMSDYNDQTTSYFVSASIDLRDSSYLARNYATAATEPDGAVFNVTVPVVHAINESDAEGTQIYLYADGAAPEGWQTFPTTTPGVGVFFLNQVTGNIAEIRSLGLLDAVTSAYTIPTKYVYVSENQAALIKVMGGKIDEYDASTIPYQYGTYTPKNKKVFSLYNLYRIRSSVSGDIGLFEGRELYSGGQYPGFWIFADVSPNGRPYCQPIWYQGSRTKPFQNSIAGAQWVSAPIVNSGASGHELSIAALNRSLSDSQITQERLMYDIQTPTLNGVGIESIISDVFSQGRKLVAAGIDKFTDWAISTTGRTDVSRADAISDQTMARIGGGRGAERQYVDTERSMRRTKFYFDVSQNLVVPEIRFGRFAEMQEFIGNGFYIDRVRLSENDMERLDNFLTMYGYADDRRLESEDFTSHVHFNYVQADNVAVEGPSMFMCNLISDYFAGGVRLWHELPNRAAMSDNPIKGGA